MHAVTVAFECGGNPSKSARAIVQGLWGPEAGGRDGIAGSPRGVVMGTKGLLDAVMKAEEADRLREEAAEAEKVAAEAKGCADKMESAGLIERIFKTW